MKGLMYENNIENKFNAIWYQRSIEISFILKTVFRLFRSLILNRIFVLMYIYPIRYLHTVDIY